MSSSIVFVIAVFTLRLLKNHKNDFKLKKKVLFVLHVGLREKINIVLIEVKCIKNLKAVRKNEIINLWFSSCSVMYDLKNLSV